MLVEYENCPKAFYYKSWLGLKLPQSREHLEFGSAIHLAIDNIYEQYDKKDKWKNAEISIPKKIFKSNFKLEHFDGNTFTEEERLSKFNEMLADGLEIIEQFWAEKERLMIEKEVNPTKFEIPIKTEIQHPDTGEPVELPLSCRIDALTDGHKIIEFKTSSKEYVEEETKRSLQALSYATVHYQLHQIIPIVDYIVMIKKRKKDKIQHFSISYNKSDLISYVERVNVIIEKIKNREFSRLSKNHPFFCDCVKFDELFTV